VPDIVAAQGDPWTDIDDHVGDLAPAMRLWERDLGDGLGEMPFPPDYPKMPGEPARVQPSRAKRPTSENTD